MAFLALAAPASAALQVGIGDQQPAAFADARLRALKLPAARMIVPWDAATTQPEKVAAWLAAVSAAGMAPHVAFEHRTADRCPGSPCVPPSRAQYRAAVEAFLARFPQVRTITDWNEANHVSQPTATRPEAAAGYYDELRAACLTCKASPGVTWRASWSRGRLILRQTCAVAPCRGKVTVRLRSTTKTIKLVGTRTYTGKTLKLRVSAKVRAKLRKVARRRVHLTVRSTGPAVATQRVVLKLR